jgi:seryl-tRNA synthetase
MDNTPKNMEFMRKELLVSNQKRADVLQGLSTAKISIDEVLKMASKDKQLKKLNLKQIIQTIPNIKNKTLLVNKIKQYNNSMNINAYNLKSLFEGQNMYLFLYYFNNLEIKKPKEYPYVD